MHVGDDGCVILIWDLVDNVASFRRDDRSGRSKSNNGHRDERLDKDGSTLSPGDQVHSYHYASGILRPESHIDWLTDSDDESFLSRSIATRDVVKTACQKRFISCLQMSSDFLNQKEEEERGRNSACQKKEDKPHPLQRNKVWRNSCVMWQIGQMDDWMTGHGGASDETPTADCSDDFLLNGALQIGRIQLTQCQRNHYVTISDTRAFSIQARMTFQDDNIPCRRAVYSEVWPILDRKTKYEHDLWTFPCYRSLWSSSRTLRLVHFEFIECRRPRFRRSMTSCTIISEWNASDMIPEDLYKSKLQDSVQLQVVLTLYDQEITRNNGKSNYHKLKTAVKLHIDQMMRTRNLQGSEQCCGKRISKKGKKNFVERKVRECF